MIIIYPSTIPTSLLHTRDNSSNDTATSAPGPTIGSKPVLELVPCLLVFFAVVFLVAGLYCCPYRVLARRNRLVVPESPQVKPDRLDKTVPRRVYSEWKGGHHKYEDGSTTYPVCAICLELLLDTEQVRGLPCEHVFHEDCLVSWFRLDRFDCPLCKRAYYTPGKGDNVFVRPPQDAYFPVL